MVRRHPEVIGMINAKPDVLDKDRPAFQPRFRFSGTTEATNVSPSVRTELESSPCNGILDVANTFSILDHPQLSPRTSMDITKFAIPEIIFGRGSLNYAGQCALRLGAKKVFLVSDEGIEEAGWLKRLMDILEKEGVKCSSVRLENC
jgi:hypothetical protein